MTVEDLAAQVGITERYLYRIENENKKPRYEVLYKLIRTLSIHADIIFYPEKSKIDSEMGEMLRLLCSCDPRFRDVAKAMLRALIDTANKT